MHQIRSLALPFLLIAAFTPHSSRSADTDAQRSGPSGSDADWSMPGKDYATTRYSPLADISAANASRLHPVWTFSTGVLGGHEGQPLVIGDTMYVVTPYSRVVALDSSTGKEKWA